MTKKKTEAIDDARVFWAQALAPASGVEMRLANSIARHDFMMFATMEKAMEAEDASSFERYVRIQRDLAITMDSLINSLSLVRKQRLETESQPPPPPAKDAKVIPFPKPSHKDMGSPPKISLDMDPQPGLQPFAAGGRERSKKERGERSSLELKVGA